MRIFVVYIYFIKIAFIEFKGYSSIELKGRCEFKIHASSAYIRLKGKIMLTGNKVNMERKLVCFSENK